jgi:signal transduction histidine kinase
MAQARGIDFRAFLSPDLPEVHVDPDLLGEAVFQMAHNAVKFNYPGGWVKLQAGESDQWVEIEVIDSGVGLTPEQLQILKQPFSQSVTSLRNGIEGLGIGWVFARYVAQVHNGRTRVVSNGPDQGSRFCLAFPPARKVQL